MVCSRTLIHDYQSMGDLSDLKYLYPLDHGDGTMTMIQRHKAMSPQLNWKLLNYFK